MMRASAVAVKSYAHIDANRKASSETDHGFTVSKGDALKKGRRILYRLCRVKPRKQSVHYWLRETDGNPAAFSS